MSGIFKRFMMRSRHMPALGQSTTMAIFTDGACPKNGAGVGFSSSASTAQGGCAFVINGDAQGGVLFPLENQGPTILEYEQTNDRAELRAAIAALQFRWWSGEGWNCVVRHRLGIRCTRCDTPASQVGAEWMAHTRWT
ncbi:hypothetical protein IWX50DRAFT_424059 [Phyllosticta citricarpa]|uniref:RNase H type-1 domain-containing protein n=1 Tax=Phyllosticta citricarpa TaxID=55181 RepID=A0ABR1LT95_9PEZI